MLGSKLSLRKAFVGIGFKKSRWKMTLDLYRASDISRGRGPAKFRYFREIPRNSPKNAKYREIRQKYFQIHSAKHI